MALVREELGVTVAAAQGHARTRQARAECRADHDQLPHSQPAYHGFAAPIAPPGAAISRSQLALSPLGIDAITLFSSASRGFSRRATRSCGRGSMPAAPWAAASS